LASLAFASAANIEDTRTILSLTPVGGPTNERTRLLVSGFGFGFRRGLLCLLVGLLVVSYTHTRTQGTKSRLQNIIDSNGTTHAARTFTLGILLGATSSGRLGGLRFSNAFLNQCLSLDVCAFGFFFGFN
jgi:hypothetical protein